MDVTASNPGKRGLEVDVDTGDNETPKRSKNGHQATTASQLPNTTIEIPHIPGFEDFELIDTTEEANSSISPTFEQSQSLSRATTPELSPTASSYDNGSTPGVNTPASSEDQDDTYVQKSSIFTPSEGLLRALESKNLPDDFLERFRAQYPGLLFDSIATSDDTDHSEESTVAKPTSEDGSASRRLRKSRIEFNQPPFPCPSGCFEVFDDVSTFREHLESLHSGEFTLCKHEDCVKFVPVDPETKMVLVWHYKQDHGQNIIQCTEHPNCSFRPNFNEQRSIEHIRSHRLRCHLCLDEKKRALPFGTADALKSHIKVQHSTTSFPCQGYDFAKGKPCDRRFPTEGGRTKHMGCAHKGEFLCPFCPLDSGKVQMHGTDKALALHVRDAHEDEYDAEWAAKAGEKTFACPHCETVMSKSSNLRKHIASFHAREKPFKCCATDVSASPRMVEDDGAALHWDPAKSGCETAFANKQTLIDHVRSTHFGLLRWEALKKLKSGETIALVGTRKEKQSKKAKVSASNVLSGVGPDASG